MDPLDLRPDAAAVRRMVERAVARYAAKHATPAAARRHPPVSRIDLTFSFGDGESDPGIDLHFDDDPAAEPTGGWTRENFAVLNRRHWLPAWNAACDGGRVAVVGPDGKTRRVGAAGLARVVGELLVGVLKAARDDGVFAGLPRAARCELGVEESDGDFGWPRYEHRGRDNLVAG